MQNRRTQMTFAGDKEIVIAYAENGIASVTSSILRYSNKIKKLAKKFQKALAYHER